MRARVLNFTYVRVRITRSAYVMNARCGHVTMRQILIKALRMCYLAPTGGRGVRRSMPRLSLENRQKVVRLFEDGHRPTEILARLEEEDVKVSKVALYALLKKYRETGRVEDRARARAPKKLSGVHYSFIDSALQQDDELTTAKLYDQLLENFPDVTASKSTVKRARRELGWVTSAPKYCQLTRDNNKRKRLDWCRKMLQEKEEFKDVIWTDESTVMIDQYSWKCYRKRGEVRKLKARPKHPAKVHVWGGDMPAGSTVGES